MTAERTESTVHAPGGQQREFGGSPVSVVPPRETVGGQPVHLKPVDGEHVAGGTGV
uniref:hypothetical protein n=1 Tax=Streptomyces scabiei TaxID=1930 RepID=UPI0019690C5E|nr:hypothetical protein [Streptomyces scabiei]